MEQEHLHDVTFAKRARWGAASSLLLTLMAVSIDRQDNKVPTSLESMRDRRDSE